MNCIFHIPLEIDPNYMSGSHIRPQKMIKAFKNIGYNLDIVEGRAKDRKIKIKEILKNIENGKKYDFLYSESSNMPTLLTEPHHMPTHPFLDFGFFKKVKKAGIPIGLYYRDIHWIYPAYRKNVPGIKGLLAIWNFKYDLKKYNELLDILYLQTMEMESRIPIKMEAEILTLPPGADSGIDFKKSIANPFHIFYVGGLGSHYEMEELFKAVQNVEEAKLTICTRVSDWEEHKDVYEKYISDRIKIVHKNHDELQPYFEEATVVARYFISENSPDYNDFCVSIKLYEYLGNQKPIITIEDTAIGDFVEKYNIGWAIEYDGNKLEKLIRYLIKNPEEIFKVQNNMPALLAENTWEARAEQVAKDLLNYKTQR